MADRKLARGTQLQRFDGGSPGTWVKIAQARDITGPSQSATIVQLDDHDVEAGYLKKLKTALDGGQVTLELHFDPDEATHEQLQTDFEDMDDIQDWRLVIPNSTKGLVFSGTVQALSPGFPVAGAMVMNLTIEVDGPVQVATIAA